MRRRNTAENQHDAFQMHGKKAVRNTDPAARNGKVDINFLTAVTLCHGWVRRGCTLSSSIYLPNNGTAILMAMGIFALMGFRSSSYKRFKKKL